jgi:serine/threonine protein phosphatase PrpC
LRIGAKTDRGKVREQNEDAYGYRDGLFVVADGMGGHQAGEVASAITVETVLATELGQDIITQLRQTVLAAHAAILERAAANPDLVGMGTTVAVLVIDSAKAYYTHIGDSRIYLWRDAELRQLTNDHSLVAELVRTGELTKGEARVHPKRSILTQALGGERAPDLQVQSLPLQSGDKFLLCTDGLTGTLEEAEIQAILSRPEAPAQLVEKLIAAANDNGGPDNISTIIVEF